MSAAAKIATIEPAPERLPDPTPAETPTRQQLPATTAFNGGEGCWFDTETVYFTTKGDNRVWALNAATSVLELVYDDNLASSPVLRGVDNVTVNTAGEIFVAEDGGDMQIVVLAPLDTRFKLRCRLPRRGAATDNLAREIVRPQHPMPVWMVAQNQVDILAAVGEPVLVADQLMTPAVVVRPAARASVTWGGNASTIVARQHQPQSWRAGGRSARAT